MGIRIVKSPAGGGKTHWAADLARQKSTDLDLLPYVILPSTVQVDDFRRRLALMGGALGVNLGTFREAAEEIVGKAPRHPVLLSETKQAILLSKTLAAMDLDFYHQIKSKPGFVMSVLKIMRELRSAGITPDQFMKAATLIGGYPRLQEIAAIYTGYGRQLNHEGWVDSPGLIQEAVEFLSTSPGGSPGWGCLIIDGFDDLTPLQLELVIRLGNSVPEVFFTITGEDRDPPRSLAHKRFLQLEKRLLSSVEIEEIVQLDFPADRFSGSLQDLGKSLFAAGGRESAIEANSISMVEAPDRESEIREALRWIRSRVSGGQLDYPQAAITMRSLEPYRKLIYRVAQEYDVPIRLIGGLPLIENSLVAALLQLLRLASEGENGLVWHEVISLWRSPYFDLLTDAGSETYDRNQKARELAKIARWGNVIRGYGQWQDAFLRAMELAKNGETIQELPSRDGIQALWEDFQVFLEWIRVPEAGQLPREYLIWIEKLLGEMNAERDRDRGLNVYSRALQPGDEIASRDLEALRVFFDVLRELNWSAEVFTLGKTDFSAILVQLESEIGRRSYQPIKPDQGAVVCADSRDLRGISFKSVALVGIAEGEFPAAITEDPFLRDADRKILRETAQLPLQDSTDSAEAEFFYEAITRAWDSLLITRPRMAENGAPWKPSPYWEEVLRISGISPIRKTSRSYPDPDQAGSLAEVFQLLGELAEEHRAPFLAEIGGKGRETIDRIDAASALIKIRRGLDGQDQWRYNGGLEDLEEILVKLHPEDHVWSASRLESYQTCPLNYYYSNLLGLEKLEPPLEGLDARQLGNIYHHIVEDLYQAAGSEYTLDDLLNSLPEIADRVFSAAPQREGFRATAWWEHTRTEIIVNLERSLIVLEGMDPSFRFYRAEQKFGIRGDDQPHLTIEMEEGGRYSLRGFIDRVDRNQSGDLRIIDYKTSGRAGFDNLSVKQGKKLQLPLYARAARDALKLGRVVEGFYFHLLSAQPSYFSLGSYRDEKGAGAESAISCSSLRGWEAVKSIRKGSFQPDPPANGCPNYCPAAGFCWSYRPKQW